MPRGKKNRWNPNARRSWLDRNVPLVFLTLTAVAVASVSVVALNANRTAPTTSWEQPALAQTSPAERPITAAIIGDSYTGCSPMGGCGATNYTEALSAELGWRITTFAEGGTGYVNAGPSLSTFADRVAGVIAAAPDVVILQGSRNDSSALSDLDDAVRSTIDAVKAGLPDAVLVVIGPISTAGGPPGVLDARTITLNAAADNGAALIVDPIAEAWFDGENAQYIGIDGVHPTDDGHLYMADLLSDRFRSLPLPT